jgi:hypothetical protein
VVVSKTFSRRTPPPNLPQAIEETPAMSHEALRPEIGLDQFRDAECRDRHQRRRARSVGARRECAGLKRTEIDNFLTIRPARCSLSVPVDARKLGRLSTRTTALILRSAEGASRRMLQGALIGWRWSVLRGPSGAPQDEGVAKKA